MAVSEKGRNLKQRKWKKKNGNCQTNIKKIIITPKPIINATWQLQEMRNKKFQYEVTTEPQKCRRINVLTRKLLTTLPLGPNKEAVIISALVVGQGSLRDARGIPSYGIITAALNFRQTCMGVIKFNTNTVRGCSRPTDRHNWYKLNAVLLRRNWKRIFDHTAWIKSLWKGGGGGGGKEIQLLNGRLKVVLKSQQS